MQSLLLFAFTMFLFHRQINCILDKDLIKNYLNEKSAKYATIFTCTSKREQIKLAKNLMLEDLRKTSIFNIKTLNEDKIKFLLLSLHEQISVVLDGDCPNINNLLLICGENKFFDVKHHWLIISSSLDSIVQQLEGVELNINADIHLAISSKNTEEEWTIIDTYNAAAKHGGLLNYTKLGYYNRYNGYNARMKEAKYWIRKNMTGVTFRTMVVLPIPFEGSLQDYLASDEMRTVNTFNRFHSRLVQFCRDYYNFSMNMSVSKSWGYLGPDGTFDGLVGALNHSEVDFGTSPLFVRTDRAQVMEYGRNTWILRAEFIFRNPKSRASIEIFLKPLSTTIWLITGMFSLLSIALLKLVTTYERKKFDYNIETSWSFSALFTLGAFCQQGAPSTPYMTCGRITTITIFLLSVIIYQFYSASIVSNLLMKPSTTIKNLKDLLLSPIKVGCEDILYTKDYFGRTTDEVAKELYYKKVLGKKNTSNFLPPAQGLHLVENGGYAFHVEVATAYPIIEETFHDKAICELREVNLFPTQPMHANYQKHSPFRDMLDTCLQREAEHGILYRERKHWHPRKPECIQSSRSITFNVGIDEFYPALVIYLIGLLCSLAIFVAEKQVVLYQQKSKTKRLRILPFKN